MRIVREKCFSKILCSPKIEAYTGLPFIFNIGSPFPVILIQPCLKHCMYQLSTVITSHFQVYPAPLDGPQEQASRPATNPPPDQDPPSPGGSHISLVVVMVLGFVLVVMAVSGLAMVFFGRRRSR